MTPTPSARELLDALMNQIECGHTRGQRTCRSCRTYNALATIIEEAREFIGKAECECAETDHESGACWRCRLLARIDGGRHE